MGRKKITIEPITDERNRHVTFNKRKSGLIKKAMELSILCNCQISFLVFNAENQLFEYCSTDPRLILQQYCKVAHLPHERLSNADYPRFDKASRGSKGRKKGGDLANDDSDDMSNQGMSNQQVKEEQQMMQMPNAMQRRNSYVDPQHQMGGQMMQPVIQVHQQQQPQYDINNQQQNIQLQRRPSVSNMDHQQQHLMSQIDLLTPITPNTMDRLTNHMMQQQHQQQQHMDDNQGMHHLPQQQQQIGFHQAQEIMQQQQPAVQQQRLEGGKRKYDEDEYSEPKRAKMGLAPLQVPSNPQSAALRRLDGNVGEDQQQYEGNNEGWQQQQNNNNNGNSGQTLTSGLNENGEITPLNYMFSPVTGMGNISTPIALNNMDWNPASQKSRDQQSS